MTASMLSEGSSLPCLHQLSMCTTAAVIQESYSLSHSHSTPRYIYGHNDAVFSSLPFAHSLTTYTTTTDDIGQLLCAVHNSLLLQHDTCGLRMFLIVLFTSCVITPIDSCFGVPVICPVHISYLVLHCWGRTPSFTIFTSPLQL